MSQKIEGTPPAAVRTTGPVGGRVAPAGAERSRPVEASAGGDSLRLTGEAASLQAMQRELSNAPAINEARVQAVREALQAGTYKVEKDKLTVKIKLGEQNIEETATIKKLTDDALETEDKDKKVDVFKKKK